ncbi:MAG: outer membrane beta-barrel protein [Devosia sp.]|nr:outer membrane beta-barrel protein [Devosia sp.]
MLKLAIIAGMATAALCGTAYAADLSTPADATNWTGAYIGVNAGYGPGTASDVPGSSYYGGGGQTSVPFAGGFVGGQIGYNYQLDNGLVFGAEADINWAKESGSANGSYDAGYYTYDLKDDLNWFGAVTGHVGYAWDKFMPYVLGGVAFANNTLSEADSYDYGYESGSSSSTATHVGFTAGIGLAALLTERLSGFVEVRYADYGSASYTLSTYAGSYSTTSGVALTDTTVRAGLNFHF